MKMGMFAVGALVLGMLAGCGPVEGNEELSSEELVAPPDGTVLSPELMTAVLTKVPKVPEEMLHGAASCQPAKTCAGFGSCGAWSGWYNCGLTACDTHGCRTCDSSGDNCQYRGGQRQLQNRYRVCFNTEGESCTEYGYQNNQPVICGCNDL